MPLYTYICETCDKLIEAIVPLKDCGKPLNCRHCGNPLTKIIMPVNFWVK